ncbi:hypothetical protein RHSIM_Rhsim06G0103700 [Rhododendron simsii]|uniref:Uncharacterized protein n=1 Tax=Rhododendron simsii TaxID=118357 RepID=A0A834GW54_RHOSS|nr:hypothetical protein RHSIM_Rhsim06G0103700 [Rhododendron simsii]
MDRDRDDGNEGSSDGDGAVARGTDPSVVTVPMGAEESSSILGEGPIATVEGGGGESVMPMDSAEAIEGFVISTASDGATASGTPIEGGSVATVEEDIGVAAMEECRTGEVEHLEHRTVEVSIGDGDTVMGEHRMAEGEHRTVEEPTEGSSRGSAASVPATPTGTPFTPAGSVIEMEIGGLDVSVERRAMEEKGTPASATPPEFPFTPSDTPIETESRGGEDEDAEAVVRRLVRGKSVVGESDGQEARDPLAAPLFRPPIGSSREQGVSLRDTLECADPWDLSARLAEAPSLVSVLASEEVLQEAEREEEERHRAREGPRVTLVQEVEAAARERAAFDEASYVPRVHFFVPFGVDAFVPRQSLQEEQVLHDLGSHMGMFGPLDVWRRGSMEVMDWAASRLSCPKPGGDSQPRSIGVTFRLAMVSRGEGDTPIFRAYGVQSSGRLQREILGLSSSDGRATVRCYRGGGNESEAATGASGSRGSRQGGASSRHRSGRGRGTGRVAEVGRTFPELSRVVSVVTREGIEGEIAIPSRSASITLPEAEVPRAWVENVYWLLLDCFTVIRQGAMGVSPKVLPRGATAAAQRGGARRRSLSGGPTVCEGGREESSSRGGGQGEATSRGRGVWVNPFKKIGIAKTLSEKLGISNNAAKSLTEGRVLNIPRLINQFRGFLVVVFTSILGEHALPFRGIHTPVFCCLKIMKTGSFKTWRQELDGMRIDLRHNLAYAPR